MAVGMFCNLWPHLAQAAILQVQDNHNCVCVLGYFSLVPSLTKKISSFNANERQRYSIPVYHYCE